MFASNQVTVMYRPGQRESPIGSSYAMEPKYSDYPTRQASPVKSTRGSPTKAVHEQPSLATLNDSGDASDFNKSDYSLALADEYLEGVFVDL